MFTTAIVPLDGSPLAARAVSYARRLARAGTRLVLVRAYLTQDSELSFAEHYPYLPSRERERLECKRAQAEFVADVERFQAEEPAAVTSHFAEGHAADVIVDAALSTQADLIVMSTHGRGGLGRLVFGSVADEVVRHAPIPILLVPAACTREWAPDECSMRLLVPLDGSSLAAEALGPAAGLASMLRADLVLLGVVEPAEAIYPDALIQAQSDLIQDQAQATSYLDAVAADLRSGSPLSVQVKVSHGVTAETIVRVAREIEADAIVMATHGRGGLERLVLGSVAAATLERAHVPVLLSRATRAHTTPVVDCRAGERLR